MPGLGFGFSTVVWMVALLVVAGIIWGGRKSYVGGTPIVLKSFRINEDPAAKVSIEIVGRASGIVSYVLTWLKLDPEFELNVTDSEVTIRAASLSGIEHIFIPLRGITATMCGYQRSIWALGFAILFGAGFVLNFVSGFVDGRNEIGSDMGLAFGFLVLAGIAGYVYFVSKRIAIQVESMHRHGMVFKRSVIEGVSVDLPDALRAISVINARLSAAQGWSGRGRAATAS